MLKNGGGRHSSEVPAFGMHQIGLALLGLKKKRS